MKKFFLQVITILTVFLIYPDFYGQDLNDEELKTWWQKDLELDSIPGIGLERTYQELIKGRKGQEVVVAVLDTKIDMLHEDFQGIFWVNNDEIPYNGIDDDNNGYIDDTNGWNFLGNTKNEDLSGQVLEPVRIVKLYQKEFENVDKKLFSKDQLEKYEVFKRADSVLKAKRAIIQSYISKNNSTLALYRKARDTIPYFLEKKDYSYKDIDSLVTLFPGLSASFEILSLFVQYNMTEEAVLEYQEGHRKDLNALSISNVSRTILEDNENEISDSHYGNPILINNELKFQHSTGVSGLIAANRKNGIGIKGFSDFIKLMPIVMVADGDENDKDVALGIRYAVDNGAEIINMSWGKYFSSNFDWVRDAIAYAHQKDVLLVTASGNDAKDIDKEINYPTDLNEKLEFVSNFIKVGGITHKIDTTLVASFSNYGKNNVDIFAPSQKIYTTQVKSTYYSGRGTSYASPMVAGTAALLKSYFPKLSAVELKDIILKSATKIDLMVRRPGDEEDEPLVPFSTLSKTGAILNTYDAFKLAEERSKEN